MEIFAYPIRDCIAFIQNSRGSWDLPSLTNETILHFSPGTALKSVYTYFVLNLSK